MGLNVFKPNLTPWKDKKFGYIPFPKTDRAIFLNEKVLPSFYKCKWPWSRNARSFVQDFHTEGRRQYDQNKKLKDLEESLKNWEEHSLPKDSELKPNDNFKYKITQLKTFAEKLTKLRNSVREDNESLFTRNGKLKTGQQCAHTFNENCMGLLQTLDNKIQDLLKTMQNAESKHTRMYPFVNTATASKKRRQKENKNKAKRRKSERDEKILILC